MPHPQRTDRRSPPPLNACRLGAASAVLALLAVHATAQAQTAAVAPAESASAAQPNCQSDCGPSIVRFTLRPRDTAAKAWALQVDEHGNGSFAWAPQPLDQNARAIRVSPETRLRLFGGVPAVQAQHCETRAAHIAQTGRKVMLWRAGAGTAECTFNWSDDPALNDAAAAFQGIAETLRFGEELARLHRFDRLGLDAALDQLQTETRQHYAIELGNIAPTLDSIAHDERVMERARRKAARLLPDSSAESAAASVR